MSARRTRSGPPMVSYICQLPGQEQDLAIKCSRWNSDIHSDGLSATNAEKEADMKCLIVEDDLVALKLMKKLS